MHFPKLATPRTEALYGFGTCGGIDTAATSEQPINSLETAGSRHLR